MTEDTTPTEDSPQGDPTLDPTTTDPSDTGSTPPDTASPDTGSETGGDGGEGTPAETTTTNPEVSPEEAASNAAVQSAGGANSALEAEQPVTQPTEGGVVEPLTPAQTQAAGVVNEQAQSQQEAQSENPDTAPGATQAGAAATDTGAGAVPPPTPLAEVPVSDEAHQELLDSIIQVLRLHGFSQAENEAENVWVAVGSGIRAVIDEIASGHINVSTFRGGAQYKPTFEHATGDFLDGQLP